MNARGVTAWRVNARGVRAIYASEMEHFRVSIIQNLASPIITTALYFLVFGATFAARIGEVGGVDYREFIIPGLVLMAVVNQSYAMASMSIFTRRDKGTIYEILSAPLSAFETALGFILPEAVKGVIIGLVIALTAMVMLGQSMARPGLFLLLMALASLCFSSCGFVAGLLAKRQQNLQAFRMFFMSPMIFLGGIFYEIRMLPSPWNHIAAFDPVVYLAAGMRFAMFGHADQPLGAGLAVVFGFMALAGLSIAMIFQRNTNLRA